MGVEKLLYPVICQIRGEYGLDQGRIGLYAPGAAQLHGRQAFRKRGGIGLKDIAECVRHNGDARVELHPVFQALKKVEDRFPFPLVLKVQGACL